MKLDKLWLNEEQYQQWRKQEKSYSHLTARIAKHYRSAEAQGVLHNNFTLRQWLILCALYDNRCVYCGKEKDTRCPHCGEVSRLTIEHLIPYSQGGQNTLSNIVPACLACNFRKRNGPLLAIEQPLLLVKAQVRLIHLSLVKPWPLPPLRTKPPQSVVYRSAARRKQIALWLENRQR